MSELNQKIFEFIDSSANHHLILSDQDNLLDLPEIRQVLEEKQYRIIKTNGSLDVRLIYELQVRDNDEKIILIATPDYFPPPDIEEKVSFINLKLKAFFPNLSISVIKGLDYSLLEKIFQIKIFEKLSEDETLNLIIEDIFSAKISNSRYEKYHCEKILSAMIEIIISDYKLNDFIESYLLQIVLSEFPSITRETLKKENFPRFLQEQWVNFIEGSESVDFNQESLRKNLNHLFASNQLKPVKIDQEKFKTASKSFPLGIYLNDNKEERLEGLINYLEDISDELKTHEDWLKNIEILAKAMVLSLDINNEELKERFKNNCKNINQRFQKFIEVSYQGLFSLSAVKKPVVVSKILDHIRFENAEKKALIVIDGMNFWQWLIISEELNKSDITFKNNAAFSYIPSITAWSRQAIFCGNIPDLSKDNSKEGNLFRAYWIQNGYKDYQVSYERISLLTPSLKTSFIDSTQILGLVANDLDDMMHGTVMGNLEYKEKTSLWIKQGSFIKLLKKLKEEGFRIFVTADHGNIEADGVKNLKQIDKLGSISRSKRHIHFSNETMLENFLRNNSKIDCGTLGLSAYLRNEEAFTTENAKVVTHGGSHFWEVLVPFITI